MTEEIFSPPENFQNNLANVANVAKLNLNNAIDPKANLLSEARKIADEILEKCKEQPNLLISDDFINAFRSIKAHDAPLAIQYRIKLKQAKPGCDRWLISIN